jgi:uncharacterized protein (TIGR02246 family)
MARKWLVAVLSAVVVTMGVASGAQADGDDRGAFQRILKQQQDAWFNEDGKAFAATFTKDADFVTFNGDHLQTRDGIAQGLQYYFDKYIDHNHIKVLDETVNVTTGDLALIVRTTCLVQPPGTDCREGSLSRNTNVLVKRRGQWQQQSFQDTRIVSLP